MPRSEPPRWFFAAVAMLAAGTLGAQTPAVVECTASFRERIALPPGAILEATLEDASGPEPAAEVVGTARIENPGDPPLRFEIPYDPARIDESRRYAVRARITLNGRLMFVSQSHPVLTHGHGRDVRILLRRPAPSAPTPPEIPDGPGSTPMRGMYRSLAGVGRFTDCATGQSYPVAQEAANAALEAAYSAAIRRPGDEMLAAIEGSIQPRPKTGGAGDEPTLVVSRLLGLWPGETCGAKGAAAPLENTYWRLTSLGTEPVILAEGQQAPYILLEPASRRAAGSGGCNRMTGGYELEEDKLTFGAMSSTMMACLNGMEIEKDFHDALGKTRTWKIEGRHLELYDEKRAMVARFEAQPVASR